jgi:hypothetical protein
MIAELRAVVEVCASADDDAVVSYEKLGVDVEFCLVSSMGQGRERARYLH